MWFYLKKPCAKNLNQVSKYWKSVVLGEIWDKTFVRAPKKEQIAAKSMPGGYAKRGL